MPVITILALMPFMFLTAVSSAPAMISLSAARSSDSELDEPPQRIPTKSFIPTDNL